jgi:hypothetical protein
MEKTFTITYPWVFGTTRLYPIDPKDPKAAFVLGPVTRDRDEPLRDHIGFCRDCDGLWDIRGTEKDEHGKITCAYKDRHKHGHILIACDDGMLVIQAPISSKSFFAFVLEQLVRNRVLVRDQANTAKEILREDMRHLLPALTRFEDQLMKLKEVENEMQNLLFVS